MDLSKELPLHRGYLVGLAYRMLGSRAEAEDAVQEAFARALQTPSSADVDSPRAWLARVVTNVCLDQLKSAKTRRETYVGPWLPEPLVGESERLPVGAEVENAEAISLAFLLVLERLSPLERAAYLLREVFDYSYAEVASFLSRDEAAVRQLVHRAGEHVRSARPRFAPTPEAHREILERFAVACASGDLSTITPLLHRDVTLWSDGGGKVHAARKTVHGADPVGRLIVGILKRANAGWTSAVEEVNGWPSLVAREDGAVRAVVGLETDGVDIYAVHIIVNPSKLAH